MRSLGDRAAEIFLAVLERDVAEREEILGRLCEGDSPLREYVEELLSAQPENDPLRVSKRQESSASPEEDQRAAPISVVGRRFGPYRIMGVIASGGMGTVYEAEQEHPKRIVALKVLSDWETSSQVSRRFALEAELLGRLRHPNIAQVYESGVFEEEGRERPYIAMERVQGKTLLAHCEERGTGLRQRLQLYLGICDAVQFAHNQGVIHRDLKPDNILIDGFDEPIVLDFGVARATDSDLQRTTLRTEIGQLIGTIPYMSPEQVSGDPTAIDTRTDVYSLGVILYELLTGRLPLDLRDRTVPEALVVIREEDPRPLSSANRNLRGDLDTIIRKALEKDRDRRYDTVSELAADVRRHLEDEPILARPPSTWYQLRKFARRNRGFVTGSAVSLALLFAAVGFGSYQYAQIDAASERARNMRGFIVKLIGSMDPLSESKSLEIKDVLDRTAQEVGATFRGEPLLEADVRQMIGRAFLSMPDCEERALEQLRIAWDLRKKELGPLHPETLRTGHDYGRALSALADWNGALEVYREIAELRGQALGAEHPETIQTQSVVVKMLALLDRPEETLRQAEEVGELIRRTPEPTALHILMARRNILAALHLVVTGEQAAESAALIESARQFTRDVAALYPPEHWVSMEVAAIHGMIAGYRGHLDEGISRLASAVEHSRAQFGDDVTVLTWEDSLGWFHHLRGDHAKGLQLLRHVVSAYPSNLPLPRTYPMLRLARVENAQGDPKEAIRLLREAFDVQRSHLPKGHQNPIESGQLLSEICQAAGDEAARWARAEVLGVCRDRIELNGSPDVITIRCKNALAWSLRDGSQEDLEEGDALVTSGIEEAEELLNPGMPIHAALRDTHAVLLVRQGRFSEAWDRFLDARRWNTEHRLGSHWFDGISVDEAANCLVQLDRTAEARELLEEVLRTTEPDSESARTARKALDQLE